MRFIHAELLIVFFSIIFIASPVRGQIVNTLRGFDVLEEGWSGKIAGAVAAASGNTEYFEFEVNGSVQYQRNRQRWRLLGVNRRRTALGVEVAESRLAHLRHNYRLFSRVSSVAFLQAQYNPFIRIQMRLLAGLGGRVEILEGKRWRSAVGVTVMSESEKLTYEGEEFAHRTRLACFLTLYRLEEGRFDIDVWGFYQPLIDELDDYRTSVAASLQVDLVGGLYFLTTYVVQRDSSPPPDVERLDQSFRSGLGWDF